MATFQEIATAIQDFTKTISDDSTITIDHIVFLMSKYRNYILNQQYSSIKRRIGDANYQTICIQFEDSCVSSIDFCGKDNVLRSKSSIPFTMTIGKKSINPPIGFMYGKIQYVDNNKFKYSGHNSFFKNEIYATIGPDNHLYLKSNNPDFMMMSRVTMTAIFENIEKAAILEPNEDGFCCESCDFMDKRFPIEDAYINTLIQACIQDITGAIWRYKDETNDARDDASTFGSTLNSLLSTRGQNLLRGKRSDDSKEDSNG